MNLLTNRIIFKKTGLLLLAILFFLACKKEKNTIGLDDPSRLPSNAYFTDTITVKSSVVLIADSINTTNVVGPNSTAMILAGNYKDPLLGNISAEAYTKLRLINQFQELPAATADSAFLYLSYSYYYGNLGEPQTFKVYELLEEISPITTYYSNSPALARHGVELGEFTFIAQSDSGSAIKIPISNENQFLTRILNASKNNTDFAAEMRGIVIVPVDSDDKGCILRFDGNSAASGLNIFYTQYGVSKVYALSFDYNTKKFFRVTTDRSGTELASLVNEYDSISTDAISSNRGYIQACTGIRTRLSFPYLKNLRTAFPNIAVIRGELLFEPSPGTVDYIPSTSLLLMRTEEGKIKKTSAGAIYYVQPDDYTQYANSSVNISTLNDNKYSFPVKSYIQAVLIEQIPNDPIILSPALLYTDINRLAFDNNSKSGGLPFKLKLYFTTTK